MFQQCLWEGGSRIIYWDTDSCIFIERPGQYMPINKDITIYEVFISVCCLRSWTTVFWDSNMGNIYHDIRIPSRPLHYGITLKTRGHCCFINKFLTQTEFNSHQKVVNTTSKQHREVELFAPFIFNSSLVCHLSFCIWQC